MTVLGGSISCHRVAGGPFGGPRFTVHNGRMVCKMETIERVWDGMRFRPPKLGIGDSYYWAEGLVVRLMHEQCFTKTGKIRRHRWTPAEARRYADHEATLREAV